MTDTLGGGIGSGIGSLLGGVMSSGAIGQGIGALTGLLGAGASAVAPYNAEGSSVIPQTNTLLTQPGWSNYVGYDRVSDPTNRVDFETFAQNYNMSPGAQYLLKTQEATQNNQAAATGNFYSGANMRAQTGIAEGIANQDLVQQYQQMLAGQQQDFSQRQTAFQNLFGQETLGEKAGATQASMAGIGATALGPMFAQNAQAQASKGSGIGGLIGSGINALGSIGKSAA